MTNTHLSPLTTSNKLNQGYLTLELLWSHEQSSICVVTTLKEYLVRTKALRVSGQSQLLLSYVKLYKPVSRDTVTRWVRYTMALPGTDVTKYSAHSTNPVSVSTASRASVK